MSKFKYVHDGNGGRKTLISGDVVARSIANRTIGSVSIGEDSTMFRFSLSDGGLITFRMDGNQPEVHYVPPSRR